MVNDMPVLDNKGGHILLESFWTALFNENELISCASKAFHTGVPAMQYMCM